MHNFRVGCLVSKICFYISEPRFLCEIGGEVKEDEAERGQDCDRLTFFPVLNETPSVTEGLPDSFTPELCSHTQNCPDMRIILQELLLGEKVLYHRMLFGYVLLTIKHLNTSTTVSRPANNLIHSVII